MNKKEHLLTCLTEECAEVIQVTDKALRFGLDNGYPDDLHLNRYNLVKEYIEITAVMDLLYANGVVERLPNEEEIFKGKQERVLHYMEYARKCGTITDPWYSTWWRNLRHWYAIQKML